MFIFLSISLELIISILAYVLGWPFDHVLTLPRQTVAVALIVVNCLTILVSYFALVPRWFTPVSYVTSLLLVAILIWNRALQSH